MTKRYNIGNRLPYRTPQKMALTAETAKNQPPKNKRQEYPDGANGLYLVVQPSGAKSWAVRYKAPDGARRKVTLGNFLPKRTEPLDGAPPIGAAHTLAEARKAAMAISGLPARTMTPLLGRRLK